MPPRKKIFSQKPRRKPFSGKQKREQLQQKRAEARSKAENTEHFEEEKAKLDEEAVKHVITGSLVPSLGKSGRENRLSTIFVRESDKIVEERRLAACEPVNMYLRSTAERLQHRHR